jgi:hypothetical protein
MNKKLKKFKKKHLIDAAEGGLHTTCDEVCPYAEGVHFVALLYMSIYSINIEV